MSRFDEDTSIMRSRLAATPIELRKPELEPQTRARGIALGTLLGAVAWAMLLTVGWAAWQWMR